jgi:hypothetical protein
MIRAEAVTQSRAKQPERMRQPFTWQFRLRNLGIIEDTGPRASVICQHRIAKTDHRTADIGREPFLILTTTRDFALRRAVLPERRTGAALGNMQLRSDLLNAGSTTRGA